MATGHHVPLDPMADLHGAKAVHWGPEIAQVEAHQQPPVHKMPQANTGACDACRARKVRCLANDSAMSSKCQRCARAGRECVYTVHSKTRRRKRTDTRVKELEEKVKSLSMLLEQGKGESKPVPRRGSGHSPDAGNEGSGGNDEEWSDDDDEAEPPEENAPANAGTESFDGYAAFTTSKPKSPVGRVSYKPQMQTPSSKFVPKGVVSPDVIERGLLTPEKAHDIFNRFMDCIAPHYPAIFFPPDTSAEIMRRDRPVLFLAILAAGAGDEEPTLNLALNQEILQVYAHKVAIHGEKSLELVLSILISTLWYYPPDKFEELKFHQYIHMAATMALDIGLGNWPRASQANEHIIRTPMNPELKNDDIGPRTLSFSSKSYPDNASLESRRTLLACYLSCSSVSTSLRLPNMLRFTSWMNDCLHVLERSPDAAPTDKRFAAWIRIQRLVEECAIAFSLDDPGYTASLGDSNVQDMLKGFERRLANLMKSIRATPGVLDGLLEINFHINNVFIHEIALHPEHDYEDFRPPFFVAATSSKVERPLGPAYVHAISECMISAQTVMRLFLGMHVDTIRTLPALLYVRIIYSSIVLIKLDISATSCDSQIGKLFDRDSLRTRVYIEKVLVHMKRVAGNGNKHLLATKFCIILGKLVLWYRQIMQPRARPEQQPSLSPGKNFGALYKPVKLMSDPIPTLDSENGFAPPESMADAMIAPPIPHPEGSFMSLSSFSGAPQYPPPSHSPFPVPTSSAATKTTTAPDMLNPPAAYNEAPSHAYNEATSQSTEHSSPEIMDQFGQQYVIPMDVDPSIFNQLQEADPFIYNQDPNAWILEGIDYSAMANIPDFDWGSIPGPH